MKDINISGKTIRQFSDAFVTTVGINASNCTDLVSLNKLRTVNGNLNLIKCTSLKSLPDDLTVTGMLYLDDCTALECLPKNLNVMGLDVTDCTKLTTIPDDVQIKTRLDATGCTNLIKIPKKLNLTSYLSLEDCTSLEYLPDYHIGNELLLVNCTSLKSVGAIQVDDSVSFRDCTSLVKLADNIKINETLYLDGCTALRELPRNMKVSFIQGCPSGLHIPNDISVCTVNYDSLLDMRNITQNAIPQNIVYYGNRSHFDGTLEIQTEETSIFSWCCEHDVSLIKKIMKKDGRTYCVWVIEDDAERALYSLRWG